MVCPATPETRNILYVSDPWLTDPISPCFLRTPQTISQNHITEIFYTSVILNRSSFLFLFFLLQQVFQSGKYYLRILYTHFRNASCYGYYVEDQLWIYFCGSNIIILVKADPDRVSCCVFCKGWMSVEKYPKPCWLELRLPTSLC